MAVYKQISFAGGMDMLSNDADIANNAYKYAFNCRQRYGKLDAIYKSQDITFNLTGKFQGLYAVGSLWIAFFSGSAYYMPVGGMTWTLIPNFSLDAFVDYIYVAAVTGSLNNYLRQAVVTGQTNAIDAAAGVIQTPFFVSGTPAGLVCQDGVNQPCLITYDSVNNVATSRVLGTYDQWDNTGTTSNNQEYVPVGTLMYFDGARLYIVSGNQIYRSVSGAPLNFMVNVNTNGNKLATEALGGAETTSFAADFDNVQYIGPSTTEANTFIIGTSRNIYLYQPDFTTTIFGEPTFDKAGQLLAGIVNQFCIADNNGDTVFVDYKAVKSFNAVQSLKFAGRNDPFSKNISSAIDGIQQNTCCCFSFNNYLYFSLNTTFGQCVAIYDNINKVWVGFDITSATVGGIKMFAQADLFDSSYLAAGTETNRIFLIESNTNEVENRVVQLRAFTVGQYFYGTFIPDTLDKEHKLMYARVQIETDSINGTMSMQEVVDDERGQLQTKNVEGGPSSMIWPLTFPISFDGTPRIQNLTFSLDQGRMGYKVHPRLTCNSDCEIAKVDINTTAAGSPVSQKQQQKVFDGTLSPAMQ